MGNGTIEDFSVLPRLWRDAIVFESWEGTHNVLCAQVARDLERFGTLELVARALTRRRSERIDATLDSLEWPDVHLRPAPLPPPAGHARASGAGGGASSARKRPPPSSHIRRRLVPGYDPERDPEYATLLDGLVSQEAAVLS